MKTSRNRTKKKDWQKVDARILGQILAAQNIDFALPDTTHIAEFFAELLITIPGIISCRVCLEDVTALRGELETGTCAECRTLQKKADRQKEPLLSNPDFKCGLDNQPDIQFNAIDSLFHHFGFFVFRIDDPDVFNIYKPFIGNLANYVAISLENRLQRDLLERAHNELEFRVEERTEELRASNEAIKDLYNNAPCGYHSLDKDGFFTLINDTELRWLGYSRDEIVGKVAFRDLLTVDSLKTFEANFPGFKERGRVSDLEFEMVRKDSTILPVLLNATAITDSDGNFVMSRSTIFDLTERKRTEEALRESEEQFKFLFNTMVQGVIVQDAESKIINANQSASEILGLSKDQLLGKTAYDPRWKLIRDDGSPLYPEEMPSNIALKTSKPVVDILIGAYLPERDIYHWILTSSAPKFKEGNSKPYLTMTTFTDITERKQVEEMLRKREQEFRTLAENSPDVIVRYDREGRRIYVNPEFERVNSLSAQEVQGKTPVELSTELAPKADVFTEKLMAAMASGTAAKIDLSWTKDGKPICWFVRVVPEFNADGKVASALTIWSDITERKRAEQALWESSQMLKLVLDNMPAFVFWKDRNSVYLGCNYLFSANAGLNFPEEIIGKSDLDLPWKQAEAESYRADDRRVMETGIPKLNYEETQLTADGRKTDVRTSKVPLRNPDGDVIGVLGTFEDITERKQHEREREAIIAVSTALRHATTRNEILNVILDQLADLFDSDGVVLVLPNPQSGGFIDEMGRGIVGERMIGLDIPPGKGVCNWVVTNKKPYLNNRAENDPLFYRPDLLGDSHCLASVPLITQEQAIGAVWIARKINFVEQDLRLLNAIADIAANAIHRVILHEQTEQQLHHLIALHQIDIAISNNFDPNVTLNVILNNVKDELKVDAVSILLLDLATYTLDYAAGIGFRTRGIEQSHVKLGDGCAGHAALDRRTVSCLNLGEPHGAFVRSSLLAGEEFVLHYATPLVVKGQVKGVLEIFNRRAFEPEAEWPNYFETLATQSAIAIESASLFENLQRSNMELTLAYDATIEGWSRALDLRDRETEGHTQRVAEMALDLAKKMGMSNTEKLDLRRGALLHDIGKMGVPDSILLKPGSLSEDEMKIMRQHPMYAYQMLSPIMYLKRALDIPYCHHEKWDGSGYPRRLKEDEIPLAARVFAVVDVYDALTSDRPYRKAWPREEVYDYIQEQAGRHFDPQIVKVFLDSR